MRTFGLTGGMGMGKTAAGDILAGWGIPVIDTDLIAREVVEPGQPALAELLAAFGQDMADEQGRLQRGRLAALAFGDPAVRRRLEGILHPRIRAAWMDRLRRCREGGVNAAVVVIPLLFETGAEAEFDITVCVACSAGTQRRRLEGRGWGAGEVEARLAAQMAVERKMEMADRVVWNEAGLDVLAEQLERIVGVG